MLNDTGFIKWNTVSNETATSNETTLIDTFYIKWCNLHYMIQSTISDTVALNDTV